MHRHGTVVASAGGHPIAVEDLGHPPAVPGGVDVDHRASLELGGEAVQLNRWQIAAWLKERGEEID